MADGLRRIAVTCIGIFVVCSGEAVSKDSGADPMDDDMEMEDLITCAGLKLSLAASELVYFDGVRAGEEQLQAIQSDEPGRSYEAYYAEIESASYEFIAEFFVGAAANLMLRQEFLRIGKSVLRNLEVSQQDVRQIGKEMSKMARQLEGTPGLDKMTRKQIEGEWQWRLAQASERFSQAKNAGVVLDAAYTFWGATNKVRSVPVDLANHLIKIREPWAGLWRHVGVSRGSEEIQGRSARRQAENIRAREELRREAESLHCFDVDQYPPNAKGEVVEVNSQERNNDSGFTVSAGKQILIRALPGEEVTWTVEGGRKITADAAGTPTEQYMRDHQGDFGALGKMLARRLPTANPGALLAWIQLESGYNTEFMVVGLGGCFTMPEEGRLYLGFNDRWVRNNSGSIWINIVAEPSVEQCNQFEQR